MCDILRDFDDAMINGAALYFMIFTSFFLLQQCNDVMLMCYLSTITKGANSLNEVRV